MSLWTLSEPRRPLLGVLPGEGIGAEVTGIALQALAALDADVEVRHVGDGDIFDFCAETFAASGVNRSSKRHRSRSESPDPSGGHSVKTCVPASSTWTV